MTVFSNESVPTNGILGIEVQWESVLVVASAQKINFTGNVDVQDIGGVPTVNVLGTSSLAFVDLTDVPADYTGAGGYFVQVNATEDGLQFIDLQAWIEELTDLDLSGVNVTLGVIGGNITFALNTLIDRTNTTNTGTQIYNNSYIANYNGSQITYTSVIFTSTLSTYNYSNNTYNSTNDTYNYVSSIINYDSNSQVTYEGNVYIGGTIINMANQDNNPTTVIQSGLGQSFTNLNNVLLCDLAYAVSTPIDPTALDFVKLIIGGSIVGNNLGQGINGGAPAVYGDASQLRGNVLTPAIVNDILFGCAFKFGDSQTIEVSDFGFSIPLTDTILGVKVEVNFTSTANSVLVDCITITVYHTDGTSTTGVQSVTGLDTDNTDPLNPVVKIAIGAGLSGQGTPADPLISTGSAPTDIGSQYLVLDGNLADVGTTADLVITDSRITNTTPYLLFRATEPLGNITRTLINGQLTISSDNDLDDTLYVKVVFLDIGPSRQYMKGVATLTGVPGIVATITDPRFDSTTAGAVMPITNPVGYVTANMNTGQMDISSTGTEVGCIVNRVVFLDTVNYSDGMPYNAILDDDDVFFRKSNVSGDDEAVRWSDMKTALGNFVDANDSALYISESDPSGLHSYTSAVYTPTTDEILNIRYYMYINDTGGSGSIYLEYSPDNVNWYRLLGSDLSQPNGNIGDNKDQRIMLILEQGKYYRSQASGYAMQFIVEVKRRKIF